MSKLQKTLQDLIKKNGVFQTSQMVGLSIPKLIIKSEYPIDSDIANTLLFELVNDFKEMRHYRNMKLDFDDSEGVARITYKGEWDDKIEGLHVLATPFWNGEPYIPIDADFYSLVDKDSKTIVENEVEEYLKLDTRSNFDSIEDLLTWYRHFYLPKLYNKITETLLPRIREQFRDDIEEYDSTHTDEEITEKWSLKYKRSIDCSHPKGFSQRAHCQGRNKN